MFSLVLVLVMSVAVTAALTPLVRKLALGVGAVDAPTARRVHTRRIPRLGGIAIVVGFFVPLLALFVLETSTGRILFAHRPMVAGLVVGSLLIAGLGLCDDILHVSAKTKLLVQILAATAVYAGGLRIYGVQLPGLGMLSFGWLAYPITVLWITAIVNALNLIDGLDGLAAGVGFFACLTNFVVAYLTGNVLISLLSATLGGAIIGFLFYNFNPAKIFMGDCGSMFLGFVLATTALLGTQKASTLAAIIVPLVALGLPILDMLLAIARRFLERRSIFSADRGHIHHRLLDIGLTHRRAVLVLYGVSLSFTALALAIYFGRSWQVGATLLGVMVVLAGVVRFVGAFNVAMMWSRDARRDPVIEQLRQRVPDVLPRLASARSVDDLPTILERFAADGALLAVEIAPGERSRVAAFRWEAPSVVAAGAVMREAVAAKFTVRDAGDAPVDVHFQWDSPQTAVSPQAEILLQLVADGVEGLLRRPARARAAAAAGRLRPVS